jgi:hypothetical protein
MGYTERFSLSSITRALLIVLGLVVKLRFNYNYLFSWDKDYIVDEYRLDLGVPGCIEIEIMTTFDKRLPMLTALPC